MDLSYFNMQTVWHWSLCMAASSTFKYALFEKVSLFARFNQKSIDAAVLHTRGEVLHF